MTGMGVRAAQRVLDRKTGPFSAMPTTPARSRCPIPRGLVVLVRQANNAMGGPVTDYVLVHGAGRGPPVFAPPRTRPGELSHLLDRRIGVQTHIDDIANLLVWEELRDVVL